MSSTNEHKSELRLRTRTTLDNLEVKDLCNQSFTGLQRICDRCISPADLCLVLKETLSGLSIAGTQARRFRYKAAGLAVAQRAAEWVGPSVPSLVKHVLDRIGQEEQQSNQEELAGLLKALAVAAVAYNAGREGQQKDDNWLSKLLTEPLLRTAASGPSKQRVANGCMMVHAVLTAVLEWANYQPVIAASVDCLRLMLHYLNTGLLAPRVPEVFLPLKQCIEILGASLQPRSAQAILEQCLQGITQKSALLEVASIGKPPKERVWGNPATTTDLRMQAAQSHMRAANKGECVQEDWQMRRQAVETFITLAAAVQVHKRSEGGQWHLELTPCIQVLVNSKSAILNALSDAKYDKITHVRQAVGKALVEMDCIPSPKSKPSVATAWSGDNSDLETLLASKRAKPNSRPWSGHSTGGPSSRGSTPGDAYVDECAPSPRSDVGTAIETKQDAGDSPHEETFRGLEAQPLQDSLRSRQGSNRRCSANSSSGLDRSMSGKKGSCRKPLGHTTDPTRAAKAGAQSAGNTAQQHKENLTPPRPRQSFVKPRKQVFADFGVQVFAPLPRAVSPERELPKPSTPAEGDESPVGPLKLQIPDLTQASDEDKVTVVLEGASDDQDWQQQQANDKSKGDGQVEQTHESHQEPGDSKLAPSRQDATQQEANDNRTGNTVSKCEQWHAVRAESGPEVHVDKAAGLVSITGLPLGCSVRLLGLQHSLFEHPVKVEITAPSDRGTDHFSYSLADDRAAHVALHESQRQPDVSAAADLAAPIPAAVHIQPAGSNSSAQQEETPAEHLCTSQHEQQQQKGLDAQISQPESLQSHKDVTVPQGLHEAQGAAAAHVPQHQSQVHEQQARSGIGTPTGTSFPDSVTQQDPQQQLLQQLAAQAGFQLVSSPSQPAGSAPAVMHQAEQGIPMQAALPPQQQQWAALSHAGVNHDLNHELSQGLLHQLGQGLQSSAMQYASMQQQQVQHQSRLPAWAQQALLPDQTPPVTPPTAHYGMPGLSKAHSMQALPSPPGQYVDGGHLHEQYGPAGVRASLGGGSWHLPAWQQQQQQAQATPEWLLDQHAQQQYSNMAAAGSLHHSAVQDSGPYHTPHRSSPLDLRSSHAAAFWPSSYGGPNVRTPADPQGGLSAPMMQSQVGDAEILHSQQGSVPWQQHSSWSEGFLPGMLQDSHSDTATPAKLSHQAEMGVPSVLSGGSSGVSSPLRGSGHLESLLEVNNRVEAAMGRARAQLQGGHSQRAKPRGLSSTVEKTVSRITRSTAPQSQRAPRVGTNSRHDDTASTEEPDAMPVSAAEEEEHPSVGQEGVADEGELGPSPNSSEGEVVPHAKTPLGSPPQGSRGQGRPPLSPVRQSLQDLALSRESSPGKGALVPVSIDPLTGMPNQDINVHCNPLFTEPQIARLQHQNGAAQKHGNGVGRGKMLPQHSSEPSLTCNEGIGQQRDVPASPPSKLQQSLRALLQQHTQDMEEQDHPLQ